MKKTVISLIFLILGSIPFITLGHGVGIQLQSSIYAEQTSNQQTLTVSEMLKNGKTAYNDKNYTEAMDWYRKAADQGNADAQFWTGYLYYKGYGVVENDAEAMDWFRKAVDKGNAKAQFYLGWMYEFGKRTYRDEQEALRLFRKSADQGYSPAQERLGYMYQRGIIVTKDYTEAMSWYRKAADQGYADAQQELGNMYLYGEGVARDMSEAKKWWEKAAAQGNKTAKENLENYFSNNSKKMVERGHEAFRMKKYSDALNWYLNAAAQGNSDAQNSLGVMYDNGYGVTKDYAEALIWFRKAADQGNAQAQSNLGLVYQYGKGVAVDNSEATRWYRKAADQGNAMAQCHLGSIYVWTIGDFSVGVNWYRKAADKGNSEAQSWLGYFYKYGVGVPQDYSEAVHWYRKAADQGYAIAQSSLGDMYYNGNGVKKDYSEALSWYRKAAYQGYAYAENSIGCMYLYGYGVKKNYKEALSWYRKAADQGLAEAQSNIGVMYYNGYGVKKDYLEAVSWYRKAADQGNAIAQSNLAELYYNGYGVAKNLAEARKWWEKAAALGNSEAKEKLSDLFKTTPAYGTPTFTWIECPAKTENPKFELKVGVKTASEITESLVLLNGSATRGIKIVKNEGYDFMIEDALTLTEGNNEIRVEASNSSGRTVETRSIRYEKASAPKPLPKPVTVTQKKIALVVGNAAYSKQPLRNTLNDARAIAAELSKLGFDVVLLENVNRKKLETAINDFGLSARNYDVAMLYYAGHAIQYKGNNYLIPLDATLSTESDVEYECTNVNRILSKLEDSRVKMKIISLDACRNNPLERSWHRGAGSDQGLSAMTAPLGTFISYATSPGAVAEDGEGDHSPYTSALLETLKEKDLTIEAVFKKVAAIVVSTTRLRQTPWYASSLYEGEFVFNPAKK